MRPLLETLGLLRSLFFTLPLFYLCTTVLGVVSLLLSPINPSARRQHEYSRLWGRLLLIICGVRVRVRGLEKLDPARHYVYLANTSSALPRASPSPTPAIIRGIITFSSAVNSRRRW